MNMNLDLTKLQLVLDGETDICIRRDFTHPPARVWRGLTEPALIRQWMASKAVRGGSAAGWFFPL
jgi:uncharacterized protein YndB with AHSA1/START domain